MAKSKRAPLYEVLCKSKNPPLWTRGRREASDEPTAAAPAPETPPAQPPAIRPPASVTPEAGGTKDAVLRIDGRVIRIVLDSTRAAAALFAIVVLLGVVYGLGHGSGWKAGMAEARRASAGLESESLDEMDRVRQGPPQPDVTQGLGPSPLVPEEGLVAPAKVAPPSTALASRHESAERRPSGGWTPGMTYIVVQNFAGSARDDGLRAQAYLDQLGIQTSLEPSGGRHLLVTTEGFNWDDSADRARYEQYLRRIQAAGREYYKGGGQYKLEGYPKKLTEDHW